MFDGTNMLEDQQVLILNEKIIEKGKNIVLPVGEIRKLDFPEGTLMPGMIEGHSHLLLHPYNETAWNDQVLKESLRH